MNNKLSELKKFLIKNSFIKESDWTDYIPKGVRDTYQDAIGLLEFAGVLEEPEKISRASAELVNLGKFEDDYENYFKISDEERAEILNSIGNGINYETDKTMTGREIKSVHDFGKQSFSLDKDYSVIITDITYKNDDAQGKLFFPQYSIFVHEGMFYKNEVYIVVSSEKSALSKEIEKEAEELARTRKELEELKKAKEKEAYEVTIEEAKPKEKKDNVFYYTKRARCGNDVCYIKEDGTSHKVLDVEKQYPKEKIIKK